MIKKAINNLRKFLEVLTRKIKQGLCRHKETEMVKPVTVFHRISGETVYKRCKKCGKILDSISYEYEGAGYK